MTFMKWNFEAGNRVKLKSFRGRKTSPSKVPPEENYWLLIQRSGQITQSPRQRSLFATFSKQKKVLVKFDDSLADLSLECHNEIPNALWILTTDLEKSG